MEKEFYTPDSIKSDTIEIHSINGPSLEYNIREGESWYRRFSTFADMPHFLVRFLAERDEFEMNTIIEASASSHREWLKFTIKKQADRIGVEAKADALLRS